MLRVVQDHGVLPAANLGQASQAGVCGPAALLAASRKAVCGTLLEIRLARKELQLGQIIGVLALLNLRVARLVAAIEAQEQSLALGKQETMPV